MEKREIMRGKEKREFGTTKEKVIMKMFPVTQKERSGCSSEKMKNDANRAYLKKVLKDVPDEEVEEFVKTFEPKYK